MNEFIQEPAGGGQTRSALSRWACALGLLHAVGYAAGFTLHFF